jgi:lipopolysaccharide assembly protein A
MDVIGWLLRVVFFVLALWFALQNDVPVTLHLSPTHDWNEVPLVFVILLCFIAGAVAGMLALVPHMLRQRRRIARLERSTLQHEGAADVGAESLTDVARRVGAVGGLELETRTRRR